VPLRIVWDLLRFRFRGQHHLSSGQLEGLTFGEYLDQNYSVEFGELFAVPMLCVVCTCSPTAVRAYPAETLVEYWQCWALRGRGLRRATGGTKEVVAKLSAGIHELHLGTSVVGIRAQPDGQPGILVEDSAGDVRAFDHVIIATQVTWLLC
jgi:predicted NAD/FAD-binding protein